MNHISFSRTMAAAWRGFWNNPLPWLLWTLIGLLLSLPTALTGSSTGEPSEFAQQSPTLAAALNALSAVLNLVWAAFMVNAALRVFDGERVSIASFVRVRHFGAYLATIVLYVVALSLACVIVVALAVTLGMGFLVLLAVVLIGALLLAYVAPAALDRGTVWGSFSASVRAVLANPGTVLLLAVVSVTLAMLGLVTLGAGLFVVVPLTTLMAVAAWRQASGGPLRVEA